jgi:hypothetical protein
MSKCSKKLGVKYNGSKGIRGLSGQEYVKMSLSALIMLTILKNYGKNIAFLESSRAWNTF